MKTIHIIRFVSFSTISLVLWACGNTMLFDNAPAPIEDLSKSGITNQIEGVYQISTSKKDSFNEKFTNNDFSQYNEPKLGKQEYDTFQYLAKTLFANEFMEIEKKGDVYLIKNFNAFSESIYSQFFKTPDRKIEFPGENTPLHIKSSISNDSISVAIKMTSSNDENKIDTSFKIKIQRAGKLILTNSKNSALAIDSISIKQKSDAKIYFAKAGNNLYLVKKDSTYFEIMRTVVNDNGFDVFKFSKDDSLVKTNKLPVKDSSGVLVYSEELLSKLKGSSFEALHLQAVKIKNFPLGINKTKTGNNLIWIIGISVVLGIVLFIILKGRGKKQIV
jgi:hypothetical protein